jgi:hypothetical protein
MNVKKNISFEKRQHHRLVDFTNTIPRKKKWRRDNTMKKNDSMCNPFLKSCQIDKIILGSSARLEKENSKGTYFL